jgi:signal transduction histidine kinase
LLELARLQGSDLTPTFTVIDVEAVVRQALIDDPDSGINMGLRFPSEPVLAMADPELLTRLVRNLLANATRHTRSMVGVELVRGPRSIELRVRNDGPTLSDDDRNRIFEPFLRLDDARSVDEGGAGLGLAIARRIASAHGGELVAEKVPDGACFVLRLPEPGRMTGSARLGLLDSVGRAGTRTRSGEGG